MYINTAFFPLSPLLPALVCTRCPARVRSLCGPKWRQWAPAAGSSSLAHTDLWSPRLSGDRATAWAPPERPHTGHGWLKFYRWMTCPRSFQVFLVQWGRKRPRDLSWNPIKYKINKTDTMIFLQEGYLWYPVLLYVPHTVHFHPVGLFILPYR